MKTTTRTDGATESAFGARSGGQQPTSANEWPQIYRVVNTAAAAASATLTVLVFAKTKGEL